MSYPLNKYRFYKANNKIIAVSTYAGRTVRGVAVCHPGDNFDEEIGKKLAAARCNLKVAEKRVARADKKAKDATEKAVMASRHLENMIHYQRDSRDQVLTAQEELNQLLASL